MEQIQGQIPPTGFVGRVARFDRKEDFDMKLGKVLIYTFNVTGFQIVVHRSGVAFRGTMPVMTRVGVESFKMVLDRVLIHQEHLKKTWDDGPSQTFLSEEQVSVFLNPAKLVEP